MIIVANDDSNPAFVSAIKGFSALGFRDIKRCFGSMTKVVKCDDVDCVVTYGGMTRRILTEWGISYPEMDYPVELTDYFGRNIWRITGKDLPRLHYPKFVKSIEAKKVAGRILNNSAELQVENDTLLFASDLVQFEAEYRVFIINGEVVDVRPYKGDWHYRYSANTIDAMVKAYHPWAGFAIDVGVLSNGFTALVEVNDGYALGDYGLRSDLYADLLLRRWKQLTE